jgi:hypothetical protein
MRYLILIDASRAWITPVERLVRAARRGEAVEAVLLNVQPRFNRHISQFTRKADRDALRAERARAAMAGAVERLSQAQIPLKLVVQVGDAERQVAAVAAAEEIDGILVGAEHQSTLERYAIPAGVAGLAALLVAAD